MADENKFNSIDDLKKFINPERRERNQQAQKECIDSWQKLYLQITDELYSKEPPTIKRLELLRLQTNDFLTAVRDITKNIRGKKAVLPDDFLQAEQDYIKKFENLKIVIQQKIDFKQQQPAPKPEQWQHPIFKNKESLNLFLGFMAEGKEYLAECSFIYRMMHDRERPGLIFDHVKPGMFRDWINDIEKDFPGKYPLTGGLKTWESLGTNDREKRYNRLKKETVQNGNLQTY